MKQDTAENGIVVAAPSQVQKAGVATILDVLNDRAKDKVLFAIKPGVGDLRVVTRESLNYKQRRRLTKKAKKAGLPVKLEVFEP